MCFLGRTKIGRKILAKLFKKKKDKGAVLGMIKYNRNEIQRGGKR